MRRKFEIRSSKSETDQKSEARNSKQEMEGSLARNIETTADEDQQLRVSRFELPDRFPPFEFVSDFEFRISNFPSLLRLVLALIVLPAPASAHLMNTGFGPFYDGLTHLFVTPEDLLPVIALTLLGGLRGPRCARAVLFALPLTWLAAGVVGLLVALPLTLPAAAAAVTIVLGALVAADLPLPLELVAALAITVGLLNGGLNGGGLEEARSSGLNMLGVACALFVVVAPLAGQVASLRSAWARVVVRVAGSWVTAIGLFMLGWTLRGH